MSVAIVWFRRDLRLIDNAALDAAVQTGLPIVALYVHAPDEAGEWRPGAASDWWLHHSLSALDTQLRARGGRLIVRRGPSLAAITRLIGETEAVAVFWSPQVTLPPAFATPHSPMPMLHAVTLFPMKKITMATAKMTLRIDLTLNKPTRS